MPLEVSKKFVEFGKEVIFSLILFTKTSIVLVETFISLANFSRFTSFPKFLYKCNSTFVSFTVNLIDAFFLLKIFLLTSKLKKPILMMLISCCIAVSYTHLTLPTSPKV